MDNGRATADFPNKHPVRSAIGDAPRPTPTGEVTITQEVDVQVEYRAFRAWAANWLPHSPVPGPTSHLFDAWMASARHHTQASAEQRGRDAAIDRVAHYRHKKRGTVYEVLGEAEVQNAGGYAILEGDKLVVYRGEDGHLWARWTGEFHDGRFEEVATLSRKDG